MIGIQVTKDQLNTQMGEVALNLKRNYERAVSINDFLLRTVDADLINLGFSQGEVNTMKSAFADLSFQKASAFDSSQPVKLIYGLGG